MITVPIRKMYSNKVKFRINHHVISALKHTCCGSDSLIRQSTTYITLLYFALLCFSAPSQSVSSSKRHDCGYQVYRHCKRCQVVRMSQSVFVRWNDYDYDYEFNIND